MIEIILKFDKIIAALIIGVFIYHGATLISYRLDEVSRTNKELSAVIHNKINSLNEYEKNSKWHEDLYEKEFFKNN